MQVQDPHFESILFGREDVSFGRRHDLDKIHSKWQDERTFKLTLPETNIAPENGWFEWILLSFWEDLFSDASCYVSFREGKSFHLQAAL